MPLPERTAATLMVPVWLKVDEAALSEPVPVRAPEVRVRAPMVSALAPIARVPPEMATAPALARTLEAPSSRVPSETVVPPVWEVAAASVSLPDPALVRAPLVAPPERTTSDAVVRVRVPPRSTAPESVRTPESVASPRVTLPDRLMALARDRAVAPSEESEPPEMATAPVPRASLAPRRMRPAESVVPPA